MKSAAEAAPIINFPMVRTSIFQNDAELVVDLGFKLGATTVGRFIVVDKRANIVTGPR